MTRHTQSNDVGYSAEQTDELVHILYRASAGAAVDRDQLIERITDLLIAVGQADDGTEFGKAFREEARLEPRPADLANEYLAIAEGKDLIEPLLHARIVLAWLRAAVRGKPLAELLNVRTGENYLEAKNSDKLLSGEELLQLRDAAMRLARYHRSLVRPGAPNKLIQDTLMESLAGIFLEFTQLDISRYELPHSVKSLFIQFARQALKPFFPATEVSKKALSERWSRIKTAELVANS